MSKTMGKNNILVGVANEGEQSMKIKDVIKWEPKKISYVGQTAYFDVGGTFHSMSKGDFIELYAPKLSK